MDTNDLDKIEARLNAATRHAEPGRFGTLSADFARTAPEDLRALVAEVRRLTDERVHLERLAAAWRLTAEQTEGERDEARKMLAECYVLSGG